MRIGTAIIFAREQFYVWGVFGNWSKSVRRRVAIESTLRTEGMRLVPNLFSKFRIFCLVFLLVVVVVVIIISSASSSSNIIIILLNKLDDCHQQS